VRLLQRLVARLRALEAGAEGLVLPEVHSVDDIKAAARAAYFPPKGERGI
jgi:2-keto-3-deoxy-L-rhamnonate aldolase RhmA